MSTYDTSAYDAVYSAVVAKLTREGVIIGKTAFLPRIEVHTITEGQRMDKAGDVRQMELTVESISNASLGDAVTMNEKNLELLTETALDVALLFASGESIAAIVEKVLADNGFTDFTLEMWTRQEEWGSNNNPTLLSKRSGTDNAYNWCCREVGDKRAANMVLSTNGTSNADLNGNRACPVLGVWTHQAFVRNTGENYIKAFVSGTNSFTRNSYGTLPIVSNSQRLAFRHVDTRIVTVETIDDVATFKNDRRISRTGQTRPGSLIVAVTKDPCIVQYDGCTGLDGQFGLLAILAVQRSLDRISILERITRSRDLIQVH